ncbi:MAG: hypothetical protein Q9184_000487 [Pyrenodesmia sp. 2 TL-2023]
MGEPIFETQVHEPSGVGGCLGRQRSLTRNSSVFHRVLPAFKARKVIQKWCVLSLFDFEAGIGKFQPRAQVARTRTSIYTSSLLVLDRPTAERCLDHAMTEDPRMDADPNDLNDERAAFLPHPSRDALDTTTIDSVPSSKRDAVPRTPRTANRVRFELEECNSSRYAPNGRMADPASQAEEEDYFSHRVSAARRGSASQRAPLLTDIEAPSVTVASTDLEFNAEDLLESSRPKSGMKSAFMNMANSIIGAGIIGIAEDHRQSISPRMLREAFQDNRMLFDKRA